MAVKAVETQGKMRRLTVAKAVETQGKRRCLTVASSLPARALRTDGRASSPRGRRPAWSETQIWDTSERVATAGGVPNRWFGATHPGEGGDVQHDHPLEAGREDELLAVAHQPDPVGDGAVGWRQRLLPAELMGTGRAAMKVAVFEAVDAVASTVERH